LHEPHSRRPNCANPLVKLRLVVIQLRREVSCKEGYAAKLELVLHQRLETIDALQSRLEQERAARQRLDRECERLVEMVRLSP
jgi:hypothetical protein